VPKVKTESLIGTHTSEASAKVRERVQAARDRQLDRLRQNKIFTNSEMGSRLIEKHCALDEAGTDLIRRAINSKHLSARAYTRTLKIARTIADLEGQNQITPVHLSEALNYRPQFIHT
ncbi:magnesium chelatase, partial [Patescibacteria group bacterium]|nr:magnesium chelatase [Patescibacteria group bacterium]